MDIEAPSTKDGEIISKKHDNKKQDYAAQLIDIQLSKLDKKLQFLDEYEKVIWNEKKQLEILQKMQIAERVHIASKKNEFHRQQQHHQQHPPSQPQSQSQPQPHHYQQQQQQPAVPQSHYQSNPVGNLAGDRGTSNMNVHSHYPPAHREEPSRGAGGYHPGGSAQMSIEDMLNLGDRGIDRMDDEFAKGDHIYFKHD